MKNKTLKSSKCTGNDGCPVCSRGEDVFDLTLGSKTMFDTKMKLEFNRQPKTKMAGSRFTDEEYKFLEKLAKENKESIGETIAVIIRAYKETIKVL